MRTVASVQDLSGIEGMHVEELALPPSVQAALGMLVNAAKDGLDLLPERDRDTVKRQLRVAWAQPSHEAALERLQVLHGELARSHPGAAASLAEGMPETITLAAARDRREPQEDARVHEPVRVDDRVRRTNVARARAVDTAKPSPTMPTEEAATLATV